MKKSTKIWIAFIILFFIYFFGLMLLNNASHKNRFNRPYYPDTPEPTIKEPITIPSNKIKFSINEFTKGNLKIKNVGQNPITKEVLPSILCLNENKKYILSLKANKEFVDIGDQIKYFYQFDGRNFSESFSEKKLYPCKFVICEENNKPKTCIHEYDQIWLSKAFIMQII